jgi:hypothetical protein
MPIVGTATSVGLLTAGFFLELLGLGGAGRRPGCWRLIWRVTCQDLWAAGSQQSRSARRPTHTHACQISLSQQRLAHDSGQQAVDRRCAVDTFSAVWGGSLHRPSISTVTERRYSYLAAE